MIHPDIEVRQSRIEGRGLFAKRDIAKGAVIRSMDADDEPISYKDLLRLPKRVHEVAYAYRKSTAVVTTDGWEYINHSCDPNTWWADDEIQITCRKILAGEEVTFDYGTTDVHDWWRPKWKCRCGSANCRRIITGRDCLDPAFQERYQGHLPTWVVAFIKRNQGIRGWISAGLYAGAEAIRKVKAYGRNQSTV